MQRSTAPRRTQKEWSRQDILDCLSEGKQDITITGEPEPLRLVGIGFHGVLVKDAHGNPNEFPLRLVEAIE